MPVGTAPHTIIAEAVVKRLQEIDLDGIGEANIQIRVLDQDLAICLPGPPGVMVIVAGNEEANNREGENVRENIGYPIAIVVGDECHEDIQKDVGAIDRRLKWRHDIRDALWHKPNELRTVGAPDEVFDIWWLPGQIFIPKQWEDRNMWVQAMLFRVWTCEARSRTPPTCQA